MIPPVSCAFHLLGHKTVKKSHRLTTETPTKTFPFSVGEPNLFFFQLSLFIIHYFTLSGLLFLRIFNFI